MKVIEKNRKMNIYAWVAGIIFIFIISSIFYLCAKKKNIYYVKYSDFNQLDYTVELKKNKFYDEEVLGQDRQYIASLIEHINADFKYGLEIKEEVKFLYKYKIVANVNVIDNNTNKVIYDLSEDICEEVIGETQNVLKIQEKVKVDYNKYNDLIKDFVSGYKLKNVSSILTVNMYVGIAGTMEEFNETGESVLSLVIPLTTDTVGMDVVYSIDNDVNELVTLKIDDSNKKILLNVSRALYIIDTTLVIGVYIYTKKSLSEEGKYKKELKKILNNFGTYISEVEDEFNMSGYQILRVKKFVDLLEIRDAMHLPIIMVENKESLATCFIIPTENKILYFYSLGVTQYALPKGLDIKEDEYV